MDPKEVIERYNKLKEDAVKIVTEKLKEAGALIQSAQTISNEFGLGIELPTIEDYDYYNPDSSWRSSNC